MYLPKNFSPEDESKVRSLIEQNGFITLLSFPKNEESYINHLPVIFSSKLGEEKILIGHMAKQNLQWRHFAENPKATIIVQGPHTYITPSWYTSGRDVPTWNYAVAHLYGKIELVESFNEQVEILRQLTDYYEKSQVNPWRFELPEDLAKESTLTSAIISFRFVIERTEAKFKLSQNRNPIDQNGVIEGLNERKDDMSRRIQEMMKKTL